MIHVRSALRWFLGIVALGLAVASYMNVFGEDDAERAIADGLVCGRSQCPNGTVVDLQKSPLGKTFEYRMPKATLRVQCTRTALAVGEWRCALE
jgi:hypothetical protein